MNETITQKTNLTAGLTTWTGFISQVYGFMTLGLFLTASTAIGINVLIALAFQSELGLTLANILLNPIVLFIAFFAQIGIVISLGAAIEKMNGAVAAGLFIVYSLLLGYTLSGILMIYTSASLFGAFAVTAGTFFIMTILGFVAKIDLSRIGGLAIAGLVGIIIASIVNFFLRSTGLDLVINYLGVFIFLILVAYDTQKLKHFASVAENTGGSYTKYAVIAALSLYLDFVNLFLFILRLLGKRR